MALLKKVLLGVAGVVSLGLAGNSFADDIPVTTEYSAAIQAAADNLINYINNIRSPKIADVTIDETSIVYPSDQNTFTVSAGNPQYVTHIALNSLSFKAHVVPLIGVASDVTANISVTGDVNTSGAGCQIVAGSAKSSVISFTSTPNNPLLKGAFTGDLSTDAESMLNAFIASGLSAYCPK